MMRSSKLRTKIALAGGVAVLAGTGLFAASAANASTPTPPSHSLKVANSGQASAGNAAPSSAPATVGLPKGEVAGKGYTLQSNAPGSVQTTSGSPITAADSTPATVGTATGR